MLARNLLVAPARRVEVKAELEEELKEYENNCEALHFWVKNVLRKVFEAIRDYNGEGLSLEYYFRKFEEGVVNAKAERIEEMRAKSAFLSIQNRWELSKAKNRRSEDILSKV